MAGGAVETFGEGFRLEPHQQAVLIVVEGLLEHLVSALMPTKRRTAVFGDRLDGGMLVAPGAGKGGLDADVDLAPVMFAVTAKTTEVVVLEDDQVPARDQTVGSIGYVIAAMRIVLRKIAMAGDAPAVIGAAPRTMAGRAQSA